MSEHELEAFVMNTLANDGGWLDFYALDKALAAANKEWSETVRRSYLRGAVGRLLRDGRIIREKHQARYKIGEEILDLFTTTGDK